MCSNFVIFDCDGGSDDAWALLLLLQAAKQGNLKLLGVTVCGSGNTKLHYAAKNMWRILKANDREDIPIYLGAADPLLPVEDPNTHKFHGKDGFGDILPAIDCDVKEIISAEHAVSAINRLCSEKTKQVTLIAVGPLTNIGLCYSMYGNEFADSVKNVYIMGGNYQGVGNYTRAAEFNFFSDPEAAHIVFAKAKSPITILPWEPCMEDRFAIPLKWRLETFGPLAAKSSETMKLLNDVENVQYNAIKSEYWNPCDALLVAVYLFGDRFIRKQTMFNVTVNLIGNTRGQMVLDHLHDTIKYPKNVRIIEIVNADFFKTIAHFCAGLTELKTDFN